MASRRGEDEVTELTFSSSPNSKSSSSAGFAKDSGHGSPNHKNGLNGQEIDDDWDIEVEEYVDHFGSQLIMLENNSFRKAWTFIVTVLLMYIGTWFLFQLTFIDLHKPEPMEVAGYLQVSSDGWNAWATLIDVIFWVDCVAYFFFSYIDQNGHEVDSLKLIAWRYTTGVFIFNVLASLPEEATGALINLLNGSSDDGGVDSSVNQAARTLRLQRASRLFRLARLGRLAKLSAVTKSPLWKWLQTLRGVRLINVVLGLFFAVHLLACGWYICATLHENPEDTWLARRAVDAEGMVSLLENDDPVLQWVHAMYFILTVFTTVGFGDIAAVTPGEIAYTTFTFLVGAVVHSIIIGEVISAVTRVDEKGQFITEQKNLMERFALHTEIGEETQMELAMWVNNEAPAWMTQRYDKESVRSLISGRYMNRPLMATLPSRLFQGQFLSNRFFDEIPPRIDEIPPRLPLLLALASYRSYFGKNESVFTRQDFSTHFFLVTSGTFAHVGVPGIGGGRDSDSRMTQRVGLVQPFPYQLFSKGSFFGEHGVIYNVPRNSTVRCEMPGSCIVVPKTEISRSMVEFPEFSALWLSIGARREKHRIVLRTRLDKPRSARHLAASIIQRHVRALAALDTALSERRRSGLNFIRLVGEEAGAQAKARDWQERRRHGDAAEKGIDKAEFAALLKEVRLLRSDVNALRREKGGGNLDKEQDSYSIGSDPTHDADQFSESQFLPGQYPALR